jgi:tetratricopeptide (TPR) repeat protein
MNKAILLLVLFITFQPAAAPGQTLELLSLQLYPGAVMPLGAADDSYTFGGAVNLAGDLTLPFAPALFARAGFDVEFLPTRAEKMATLIGFEAGGGIQLSPAPRLQAKLFGTGGYWLGLFADATGYGPLLSGGLGFSYQFTPAFSLGLGGAYRHFFEKNDAIQDVSVYLGTTFNLAAGGRQSRLEIQDIELDPVFPVFYKYYDENRVGRIKLRNGEAGKIEDVKVSFFVNKYMDQPKVSATLMELDKGDEVALDLKALFNDQILELTTATKVAAQISVSYLLSDEEMRKEISQTIRVYNRNNMTWDDDQKAASFVSNTDPTVLKFSKTVEATVRNHDSTTINDRFRSAMAFFESMRSFGLKYVVDPNTPYEDLSQNALALDYLQFPRQTLEYKAGDCDDLSILYAALLESIGKSAAFITIPGHIYSAVSLDMDPRDAERTFSRPEDIIILDDTVWLPVEITMLEAGFLEAWKYGAQEWRDHAKSGNAKLYPVQTAWKTYESVGILGGEADIDYPNEGEILAVYRAELSRFVQREIAPLVADLEAKIRVAGDKKQLQNRLGVLYARYGLLDKAEEQFRGAAPQEQYVPALLNLGNIFYMRDDLDSASAYYKKALAGAPGNAKVLLSLAKISYESGDYTTASSYYESLLEKDAGLAQRYAYLGTSTQGSGRASLSRSRENVVWDDE